ncbi:exodeoxyribonuclease VII small subunit [Candidatus Saccharibacteria bacterium]|nr:exodeoxyribonuclease VII small subunit [Candidatus Saccharibacteria bacterium]
MPKTTTKNYQQLSEEFAGLLAWFESDQVNLDEAIDKYEQAMEVLDEMQLYLKTAQNKIKKVTAKFDHGA